MKTADFLNHDLNRRQFLGSSAANAAGVAVGMVGIGLAEAHGQRPAGALERVRLGVIGVRTQGLDVAKTLARLPAAEVVSLCDVDERVLDAAAGKLEELQQRPPRRVSDFRRMLDDPSIDAVVVATPDHWHAAMTVQACEAGKDVYVESPVSHCVAEGPEMIAAARRHGRVVQSGLQQRSGRHFQSAVDYIRSGKLGTVKMARAWCAHRRKSIGFKADAPTPEGVDYNRWLGPAPARPFNPNRFHHNWRWYWDYGAGELGNWGVHFLDVARWGLNVQLPDRVSSTGGLMYLRDDRDAPDTQIVQYSFPGKTIVWEHRMWSHHGLEGRSAACAFYGDNGTLIVDRGGWKVYGRKDAENSGPSELLASHLGNFLDCMTTRRPPAADLETADAGSVLCHLGNIAHRVGREVVFDPQTRRFVGDEAANALLQREPRNA